MVRFTGTPMPASSLFGILSAVIAAFAWGISDFSGGLATRRNNQYQVVVLGSSVGLILFLLLAIIQKEPFSSGKNLVWAGCAGLSGAIGIAALYQGLSSGRMAIIAPTSAVIGAALPVFFGIAVEGWPGLYQQLGFLTGICGIGLVSSTPLALPAQKKRDLFLAVAAGVGFGVFFILIARVEAEATFIPLAFAKAVSFLFMVSLLLVKRTKLPSPRSNPAALLAGLLDAGGNLFYLLASRLTRLDIAAVLSCMGPAITVVLARHFLHEKIKPAQWLGVALCICSLALIALK